MGRRIKKVVTNAGEYDGTVVYFYGGVAAAASAGRIIETRDGSGNMVQQNIHGTRYIDELVMVRVKDKGELYVHQGERSEQKRPATGKASMDARKSGPRLARRERAPRDRFPPCTAARSPTEAQAATAVTVADRRRARW